MKKTLFISALSLLFMACGNGKEISSEALETKDEIIETTEETVEDVVEDIENTTENYRIIGTVHVSETECPFYIESNDNENLLLLYPINLADKYKKEGMRLKFAYEQSKGASPANCNVHMVVSLSDVTIMR